MKPQNLSASIVEKEKNRGIVALGMERSLSSSPTLATPTDAELLEGASAHLYANYAQPALIMEHGEGATLFDRAGRRYIDLFAGIAVSTLGHGHPRLTAAVSEQARKLIHLSNYFYNEPNVELCTRLCDIAQMDRVLFCNSGTEANEAALKLARRYFFDRGETERHVILAFDNSFHGRTMGSLAATGQAKYRHGFGPLAEVRHVSFGDLDAVRAAMDGQVAGIIVEPIQGEGGVVPAPDGFLAGLRAICDDSGALLIADEIQSGVGRTGTFLALHQDHVQADIVTLAKGLGGGIPIGAMLCKEKLGKTLVPGSHGTTFGGNPLASAAALAVLRELVEGRLIERVRTLSKALEGKLDALVDKHEALSKRRGRGLLQGLVLSDPTQGAALLSRMREQGVLVTFAGGTTLRITPPLTISDEELQEGLAIIDQVLENPS